MGAGTVVASLPGTACVCCCLQLASRSQLRWGLNCVQGGLLASKCLRWGLDCIQGWLLASGTCLQWRLNCIGCWLLASCLQWGLNIASSCTCCRTAGRIIFLEVMNHLSSYPVLRYMCKCCNVTIHNFIQLLWRKMAATSFFCQFHCLRSGVLQT